MSMNYLVPFSAGIADRAFDAHNDKQDSTEIANIQPGSFSAALRWRCRMPILLYALGFKQAGSSWSVSRKPAFSPAELGIINKGIKSMESDIVLSSQIIGSVASFLVMLVAVSVLGAALIHFFIKKEDRIALRPMTQPTLTVVGMMFSILLGFFIAQSMRNYSELNASVTQEANAVGEIFRLARGLNEVDRKRIRGLCRTYVVVVVDEEWAMMASQSQDSNKAWDTFQEMWEAVLSAEPVCRRTGCIYESLVEEMDQFGRYRRARIAMSGGGLAAHLWFIIACGAGAIISITFLFAPESKAFHAGILTCIIVPVTLNAYVLSDYSYPYSGMLAIKPVMFRVLQQRLFTQPDTPPSFLAND